MAVGFPEQSYDAAFSVAIQPFTIVLKVGEKTDVNVTIPNPNLVSGGQVCYTVEGFPSSGFRTAFSSDCSDSQHAFGTVLTVEATPAAAPQQVVAYVVASSGGQTAQAVLNVTVQLAMPGWIPWLGLLLFFAFLAVAVAWKPRQKTGKNRGSDSEHREP